MKLVQFLITALFLFFYSDVSAQLFGGQIKARSGIVGSLDCSSAIQSGTLYAGTNITGVSVSLPYLNGNGGLITTSTFSSIGITGLFASYASGQINLGSGSVLITIFGTTNSSGTASFNITVGGQSCQLNLTVYPLTNLYPANSVFCPAGPTVIVDITHPTNGKVWMNRNLGASQAAISINDVNGFGDLYQWGRRSDGHQCRTSGTTSTISSSIQPTHGLFITGSNNWHSPMNNNLWQGAVGVNNPCPFGYRVPTITEWISASPGFSWWVTANGRLPYAQRRSGNSGNINTENIGYYWSSSSVASDEAEYLEIDGNSPQEDIYEKNRGLSIRCIKETVASIGALNCTNLIQIGNLIAGQAAANVSVAVPYTGGNGGYFIPQIITSTGVSGLTATLSQGLLVNGAGNLTLTITGTPSTSGTANFALSVGGKNCTLSLTVFPPQPQYPTGTVNCSGSPTLVVDVTNPITGKTWMDRNLGASQAATSATDANAYGDLYQWGRRADGHQCRTSGSLGSQTNLDQPNQNQFIPNCCPPADWRIPQNPNLWQGVFGVNNPCPSGYRLPTNVEVLNESNTWSAPNSTGAFSSVLKLTLVGSRKYNDGLIQNVGINGGYWTSTTQGSASIYMSIEGLSIEPDGRAYGYGVRCIKETVATLGALNCGNSIQTGTLVSGQTAANISVSVPYTGGNGGYYASQNIVSIGVTGLTAALTQGMLLNGAGNLTLTITGTPSASGIANFALSVGGQNCTLSLTVFPPQPQYPTGTVYCNGVPTLVVDVTNPTTGKTWMDRNLGASQVATSATDANAYGDLYQWGRRADGHQCRNSGVLYNTLSSIDQPSHAQFIIVNTGIAPYDWRSPQNSNLWQGVSGINNPCPTGYRLPTETEINTERLSWTSNNATGAFASPLKLPMAGERHHVNGTLNNVDDTGCYYTSTIQSTLSRHLLFTGTNSSMQDGWRGMGRSVRCIKD